MFKDCNESEYILQYNVVFDTPIIPCSDSKVIPVLMQSVREDIRREHPSIQTSDIIVFFEVAQFSIHYKCCRVSNRKIHMLDLVLKISRNGAREAEQEARTARMLLYKVFYDQTERGISLFLCTCINSFDYHKPP